MILGFLVNFSLITLSGSTVVFIALYIYFQKKFKYWDEKSVPHAQPSFPLGNLSTKENLANVFIKLYEESKHKRYYGIWLLHQPAIMVNDLNLIKRILVSDFMNFHSRGVYYNEKDDPLSGHLAALDGSSWKNLRAKLTPTFTSGKIKMMFPLVVKCGEEMQEVTNYSAEIADVVDIKDLTRRFGADAISSCAFGIEANALKDPNSTIKKMGSKIFEPNWMNLLRKSLAFFIPNLGNIIKMDHNSKEVSRFFLRLFRDAMDCREKSDVKRNDVVDLLIQLQKKGFIDDANVYNKQEESINIEKFTFGQAAAQAFGYFLGGFETTSTVMQFALYELAINHNIQTKVREEIKHVLAKHNGKLTYESVMTEMEYLGKVVDETLRKYTTGFTTSRICAKDFNIPDSDLVIEKGTRVFIPILGIHMDERYYPNPEKFDPDRFTEEQKAARPNCSYLPFGEGPRNCIGLRFALMQTKVGLISLLSKYKFDVSPGRTPNPMKFDPRAFLPAPKGGMHLKISIID